MSIDYQLRKDALKNWEPSSAQRAAVARVAEAFGFTADELYSRARPQQLARARQVACWLLRRRFPHLSYPMIGKVMAGRDHSTVIYACRQVEAWRERDERFREVTDALMEGVPPPVVLAGVQMDAEALARFEARVELERRESGVPEEERAENDDARRACAQAAGSKLLLAALQREHPDLCGAA